MKEIVFIILKFILNTFIAGLGKCGDCSPCSG